MVQYKESKNEILKFFTRLLGFLCVINPILYSVQIVKIVKTGSGQKIFQVLDTLKILMGVEKSLNEK